MKQATSYRTGAWLLLLLMGPWAVYAQYPAVNFQYENGSVTARIDNSLPYGTVDSLLRLIGSSRAETDSLQHLGKFPRNAQGWKLIACDDAQITYQKQVKDLNKGQAPEQGAPILDWNLLAEGGEVLPSNYGVNGKDLPSVLRNRDRVTFRLQGHEDARSVFLAGSFNQWNSHVQPFFRTAFGWETSLEMKPGKHLYKFVVDGEWRLDPDNPQVETESHGYQNNVYYFPNHRFRLDQNSDASRVLVAGSFNGWNQDELKMEFRNGFWELLLYLEEGQHRYQFLVDGKAMPDPGNPRAIPDSVGGKSSLVTIGSTIQFRLPGYRAAQQICVRGDFNGWEEGEDCLKKVGGVWLLPYGLKSGNYLYQYLVDGQVTLDSINPHRVKTTYGMASLLSVNPNYTFVLRGYDEAKEVRIAGSFNNWEQPEGFSMRKDGDRWLIDLHLPPGKTLYKFVVDGQWIHDPDNAHWELNEYNTRNSVLWIQ